MEVGFLNRICLKERELLIGQGRGESESERVKVHAHGGMEHMALAWQVGQKPSRGNSPRCTA